MSAVSLLIKCRCKYWVSYKALCNSPQASNFHFLYLGPIICMRRVGGRGGYKSVDYYVSVADILSKVLQKFALQDLVSLLRVKSPPVPKASPRSCTTYILLSPENGS